MKRETTKPNLPALTEDILTDPQVCADNLFADMWKRLKMTTLINKVGFKKRTGASITEVVFLLLLWVWLSSSVRLFARKSLQTFSNSKKDALYETLKREELNWRKLNLEVGLQVYKNHQLQDSEVKAFVADDSVKQRRGKKMEGVSRHFDHLTGRNCMGQQVLTLGLATGEAFLPIDSQIDVSSVKAQGLKKPFKDGRSVVANRYREAQTSKPEILSNMIKRASNHGFKADYLLADAWFGTKATIKTAKDNQLIAILRMKNNKTQYRYIDSKKKPLMLTAQEIYKRMVKGRWEKIAGLGYQAKTADVELNLATKKNEEDHWVKVRLLFVRGQCDGEKRQVGKKDWVVFLTLDTTMEATKILELYAIRWSIEVYFKEAKQHLGLLKEQTETFASHIASIHLTAIRYLTLIQAKLEYLGSRVCDVRNHFNTQLETLDFAKRLWGLFKALISGALEGLQEQLGTAVDTVMSAIEESIQAFFVQALQLDTFTIELEAKDYGEFDD
jgi:hypothetical protein